MSVTEIQSRSLYGARKSHIGSENNTGENPDKLGNLESNLQSRSLSGRDFLGRNHLKVEESTK